MSTHLKVLPKLQSTTSELRHAPATGKENADSNIRKRSRIRKPENKGIGESDENCIKSCLTPKSDANRIPETLTCPPAPKKPMRRTVLSCKRKLMAEFDFFEADRREELDDFFRSSFERISSTAARRKIAATATADSSSSSSSSPPPTPVCNYV
ncbi:unnamed protein product [Rhodiola kirilowii]